MNLPITGKYRKDISTTLTLCQMIAKPRDNQYYIFYTKIFVQDVAQALLNALKMPETIGQTYELGGPHVYTLLECYEMFHNIIQRPPKLAHIDKLLLLKIGN